MKKLSLNISVIALSILMTSGVFAQDTAKNAPIFVSPYKQPARTYDSRIPTFVKAPKALTQQKDRSGRKSGPVYDKHINPFEGSSYGRITTEKTYYDKETKKDYKQYEYMGLLYKRGEINKLRNVTSYIQKNGVFDPKKYNNALVSATQVGSNEESPKTNASRVEQRLQPDDRAVHQKKKKFVLKDKKSDTPQRTHNAYDDDTAPVEVKNKNRPIFLR